MAQSTTGSGNFPVLYFGDLDPDNLQDQYCCTIEFQGSKLGLTLNFQFPVIDIERLKLVNLVLENLDKLHRKSLETFRHATRDQNDNYVKSYLQLLLNEINGNSLTNLDAFNNNHSINASEAIEALVLVRLTLFPETESEFLECDYSPGDQFVYHTLLTTYDETEFRSLIQF